MRITIEVKAEAEEERMEHLGEDRYRVWVKAPRRKGRANAAVVKLLRRHFGGHVRIIRGLRSSTKVVEIEG
ncbi:MAG: DUF167 domain-containing protein [Candidatus Bathyarchaeia archaeon]